MIAMLHSSLSLIPMAANLDGWPAVQCSQGFMQHPWEPSRSLPCLERRCLCSPPGRLCTVTGCHACSHHSVASGLGSVMQASQPKMKARGVHHRSGSMLEPCRQAPTTTKLLPEMPSSLQPTSESKDLQSSLGTAAAETCSRTLACNQCSELQPTLRSSTRSRFRIMEYVSRNWLSSLVALPVIIFLISLSSGICSRIVMAACCQVPECHADHSWTHRQS